MICQCLWESSKQKNVIATLLKHWTYNVFWNEMSFRDTAVSRSCTQVTRRSRLRSQVCVINDSNEFYVSQRAKKCEILFSLVSRTKQFWSDDPMIWLEDFGCFLKPFRIAGQRWIPHQFIGQFDVFGSKKTWLEDIGFILAVPGAGLG